MRPPVLAAVLVAAAVLAGCTALDPVGSVDARALWRDGFQAAASLEGVDRVAVDQEVRDDGGSLILESTVTVARGPPTVLLEGAVHLRNVTEGTGLGPPVKGYAVGVHGNLVFPSGSDRPGAYVRDHRLDVPRNGTYKEIVLAGANASGLVGVDRVYQQMVSRMRNWSDDIEVRSTGERTWKGQAAHAIAYRFENDTVVATGEVVVTDDPRRLVHSQVTVNRTGGGGLGSSSPAQPPFQATVAYTYGDDVTVDPPKRVRSPAPLPGILNRTAPAALDEAPDAAPKAGSLPGPRARAADATVAGDHYLLGGRNASGRLASVVELGGDAAGAKAAEVELPRPLSRAAAASHGGYIYVFGGRTAEGSATDAVLRLDPEAGTATRLEASLPAPRSDLAAAAVEGSIYLFGGRGPTGSPVDGILRFDPAAGTLEPVGATLPEPAGYGDTAAVLGGDVYLVGGRTQLGYRDEILRFDPEAGQVEPVDAALPHGLRPSGVASTGSTLYILGGNKTLYLDAGVYRYDPTTDVVVHAPERLPAVTTGGTAFWTGDRVTLAGGWDTDEYRRGIWHVGAGPWRDAVANGTFRAREVVGDLYHREVPLEDLRLEVHAGAADARRDPVLAIPADEGRAREGGIAVWYDDRDGDGLASTGDAFGVEVQGRFAACKYWLHVYDTWARDYAVTSREPVGSPFDGCVRHRTGV